MSEQSAPYAELSDRILAIIDWESLGLPPRHRAATTFRRGEGHLLHIDAESRDAG